MADDHHRRAPPRPGAERLEDHTRVVVVQVARGLVGEQDRRVVEHRAAEGDPLLLAAGELRGVVIPAVEDPELLEERERPPARGVPVATSDRASLPEVAGDAALYFDPLSPRSIAAALERLLADENLAARLRSQGRERARRFTWEACAEGTVAVYRQALEVAGSSFRA